MYIDIYYGFTLLLIIVTLVFATILFKKYVAFYLNFPNASFLFIVLWRMVLSRIKKNPAATKSLLEILHETCRKLQREGICVLWLHKPFFIICNEQAMKVFNNEKCALRKVPEYKVFREGVGVSLITADIDLWRIRRKVLKPAFKLPVLKHHVPMVHKNAIALVNTLKAVPKDSPVHVARLVKSSIFANIYEFLSGNNVTDPETEAEVENTIDIVDMVASIMSYRLFRPWLYPKTMFKFFPKRRNYVESIKKYQDFTKKILLEMKESALSKKENDGSFDAPKPFAQLLVQQHIKNPEFTFKDMHDEMNGLISAGYDTVAHALMWALFLLGHHEEVQEKLFNEIDGFMVNDMPFEDFQQLPYLDSVVKETLRLYPPVPITGRSLHDEVQYEGYTFPKGTDILFAMYVIHRDPKSYSDPEKFYPERFLEKDPDKTTTTYVFAEGSRSCIGKQYAMMEIRIVLAHILKNFKVTSLDRKEDVRLHWGILLTTTKPLYFKFSSRLQTPIH